MFVAVVAAPRRWCPTARIIPSRIEELEVPGSNFQRSRWLALFVGIRTGLYLAHHHDFHALFHILAGDFSTLPPYRHLEPGCLLLPAFALACHFVHGSGEIAHSDTLCP